MTRFLSLSILGLALAVALPASAQTVYQWKDAKGVTHFSDSPPPKAHTTRTIRSKDGTPAPVSKEEPPVVNAQCATAQANLKQLQGEAPIGFDSDKDGKVDRPLDADERTAQAQYAEAAIKVHCAPAAAPAASDA